MRQTQFIMGMPVTICILDRLPGLTSIMQDAFNRFRAVDVLFSTYKPESQISLLNKGVLHLSQTDSVVQEVLAACQRCKEETKGYFDVNRDGKIDPSGYVKGWAVDGAATWLRQQGVKNFFIDAGGDIQADGRNHDGSGWKVGIKHPSKPTQQAKVVVLSDLAIATSGIYERGNHIYNPISGRIVEDLLSLSVIGPDLIKADVIATAAFAMGPQKGLEFVAKMGLEGLAITKGEQVLSTAGFNDYCLV